jgi:hypothetical protein
MWLTHSRTDSTTRLMTRVYYSTVRVWQLIRFTNVLNHDIAGNFPAISQSNAFDMIPFANQNIWRRKYYQWMFPGEHVLKYRGNHGHVHNEIVRFTKPPWDVEMWSELIDSVGHLELHIRKFLQSPRRPGVGLTPRSSRTAKSRIAASDNKGGNATITELGQTSL